VISQVLTSRKLFIALRAIEWTFAAVSFYVKVQFPQKRVTLATLRADEWQFLGVRCPNVNTQLARRWETFVALGADNLMFPTV